MEEDLRFIYEKEYWYISAFINTQKFIGENKAEEIEALLLKKLRDLSDNDLEKAFKYLEKHPHAEEKKNLLVEMSKAISIECDWQPFFQNFPYIDEDNPYEEDGETLKPYNTLGYFKLEVEYFKGEPYKKEKIIPDLIQQVPFIALEILKEFCKEKENQYLLLDTKSPIYVFAISTKTVPDGIPWTPQTLKR